MSQVSPDEDVHAADGNENSEEGEGSNQATDVVEFGFRPFPCDGGRVVLGADALSGVEDC